MNYLSMGFGNFHWDYNPEELKLGFERNMAELKGFKGDSSLQALSRSRTKLSGKGYFTGDNAFPQFKKLEDMLGCTDTLFLPGRKPMRAVLATLTLSESPGAGVIGYEFSFLEAGEEFEKCREKVYIASEGESLWDYAKQFGIKLRDLTEHNRHIPYINYLREGERVKLSW